MSIIVDGTHSHVIFLIRTYHGLMFLSPQIYVEIKALMMDSKILI